MLSATSITVFLALVSSAWAAPAESCPTEPTIKSQVTAHGKQYYYRGCYDELKYGLKALNHDLTPSISEDLTVENCVAACAGQGYSLAGVMTGGTCMCDNAISEISPLLDDGECRNACNGDSSEICGGVWHYSIYYTKKKGALPVPRLATKVGRGNKQFVNIGCWVDTVAHRTLGGAYYRGDDVTPAMCADYCYQKNFFLSGVEFGNECMCGNELLAPDYAALSDCNQACAGDSTLSCGNADRLSVYVGQDRPAILRPDVLVGPDANSQYISYGCYSDSYATRTLTGPSFTADNMTATVCTASCFSQGFAYAGLELGNQCFCGQTLPADQVVDASRCDTPCAGNSAFSCGAGLRLDIYKSLSLA